MLPFRFVYHEGYDLNLGSHVFPSRKYRLMHWRLTEEGFARPEDFVEPEPASEQDLLLAHDAEWVRKLKNGTLTYHDIVKLEIPYSRRTIDAFWLSAGGTTLAARQALEHGIGFNLGGGFHHAFPNHGEGFCAINDMAVAIRVLQREQAIRKAMVVDCDVHHGNGTATIFKGDETVFTLSIHQFNNYPAEKPCSDVDIHLADGVGDAEYVARLGAELRPAIARFRPELVVYVAGADPFYQDQLGGLNLTFDGLWERDRLVIETALRSGAAVAVTLAGGYAVQVQDTVTVHINTAKVAKEALESLGWRRG
jgi:acetoin utilization deacetylase AcuC-like enzyme